MEIPEIDRGFWRHKPPGLFSDRYVDGLGALATTIWLGIEGNLLIVRESRESGSLDGRNMNENIRCAVVWLDKAKALLTVEEFDRTGLCHASFLFLTYRVPPRVSGIGSAVFGRLRPTGIMQAFSNSGKEPIIARIAPGPVFLRFRRAVLPVFQCSQMPERIETARIRVFWQAKVLLSFV